MCFHLKNNYSCVIIVVKKNKIMKTISSPISSIKDSYDFVVIGSGYGGSIAASRFSRAGQKVCLLERGEEKLPGEYPNTLMKSEKEFQMNTPQAHIGPETGLYDMNMFKDIQVLVGCGLGGTSLINANVSIKPEERIFEDVRWPEVIKKNLWMKAASCIRLTMLLKICLNHRLCLRLLATIN
jgi:cholesterol oxidase